MTQALRLRALGLRSLTAFITLIACQALPVKVTTLVNGSKLEFTPEVIQKQDALTEPGVVARTGWQPWDLTTGPDGQLWVADTLHHRLLTISPTGIVSLSVGENEAGRRDGTPDQARFREPHAITWLGDDLLIADTGNRLIRRLHKGQISTESVSQVLERPVALATDSQGRYYIADAGSGKILRVFPSGVAETVIQLEAYRLLNDLVIDSSGTLYYSDTDGIWRLSGGQRTRLLAAGEGASRIGGLTLFQNQLYFTDVYKHQLMRLDNQNAVPVPLTIPSGEPELRYPGALATSPEGLLLAELGNDRVRRLNLQTHPAKPTASTLARSGTQGFGVRRDGQDLSTPHDLLYDHLRKQIVVCDYFSNRLLTINARGQATPWFDKGQLQLPAGLAQDAKGRIYVSDAHRIVVIETDGKQRVLAGDTAGYRDGPLAQARFWLPWGMAALPDGTLYIADHGNHAIRKISPEGIVSTLAGNGDPGFANGSGSTARFHHPSDVMVLNNGQLLVADSWNHQLRQISPEGAVTTFSGGNGLGLRDGHRYKAQFYLPSGLSQNAAGEIFVADTWNHRIRRITPAGSVQTLAGTGRWLNWDGGAFDGDGIFARFNQPKAVIVAPDGRLLVADTGNNRVREIIFSP